MHKSLGSLSAFQQYIPLFSFSFVGIRVLIIGPYLVLRRNFTWIKEIDKVTETETKSISSTALLKSVEHVTERLK